MQPGNCLGNRLLIRIKVWNEEVRVEVGHSQVLVCRPLLSAPKQLKFMAFYGSCRGGQLLPSQQVRRGKLLTMERRGKTVDMGTWRYVRKFVGNSFPPWLPTSDGFFVAHESYFCKHSIHIIVMLYVMNVGGLGC